MSLSDIISGELAEKLSALSVDDFKAIARAGSLQMGPQALYEGVRTLATGGGPTLPGGGGAPRPLVIQAWSFVKDHGQYHDTYGLSSARAGELTDLLRSDQDKARAEITSVVTAALRQKGSPRPVTVTLQGMPGAPSTDHSLRPGSGPARAALKAEIRREPAFYGMYTFSVEDTGRSGAQHFRVSLGGGLYATSTSKQGAIDAARICRRHGRRHELIAPMICFWLKGKEPLYGDSIPEKVTFGGILAPNDTPPSDPVAKDKTVAQRASE